MRRLAVLIPYKAARPKSRLSAVLGAEKRREFSELLLGGVLGAFEGAGLLDRVYVVSSERSGLSSAEDAGANTLEEPGDGGVNAAVDWGVSRVPEANVFMVVPSDLPLISPKEILAALDLHDSPARLVISPSRAFDGTNLLLFSRPRPIPLSYDTDSFWSHLESGSSSGLSVRVSTAPGFTFDVDTPDDLRDLAHLRINTRQSKFARMVLARRAS